MRKQRDNFVIYQITNIVNKKFYIGSAVYFAGRKGEHISKLRKSIHHNKYLQNSFNKYGESSFKFEILEYTTKETLVEREQFYMDNLNPIYNFLKVAYSSIGFKHSEETKQSISKRMKGTKICVGRKLGLESKRKQALAKSKPILQFDSNMNFVKEWESAKIAATELFNNSKRSSGIRDCIRGRTPKAFGYIWKEKNFELERIKNN
jgi:hypothetical protein